MHYHNETQNHNIVVTLSVHVKCLIYSLYFCILPSFLLQINSMLNPVTKWYAYNISRTDKSMENARIRDVMWLISWFYFDWLPLKHKILLKNHRSTFIKIQAATTPNNNNNNDNNKNGYQTQNKHTEILTIYIKSTQSTRKKTKRNEKTNKQTKK